MRAEIGNLCGVILAGGRGRRMGGGDKGLQEYQGRPLVEHLLARLQPQLKQLAININRNQQQYRKYKLTLCQDRWPDYRGPLAGIASAFDSIDTPYLLFCPCDTPLIPKDLVTRLIKSQNQQQNPLTIVESPRGIQPLCCLMHRSLQPSLLNYLNRGERRVQEWMRQQQPAITHYQSDKPFKNINTLAQVQAVNQE
ncbi:MAG: molybdenum cofactor guanylyltransferase [Gammaproteobacteria bacterium]|nr:molybdenum cofactor guanylyltransferase [Gammaproteobacteria bacterium]MCF6230246.1 molybdenum cofactor guanylyltransferase [Gammaproteobacteria bacterium]